ncbi:hypothetical protein V5O48_018547, partial [Marasmius crinis-equi]
APPPLAAAPATIAPNTLNQTPPTGYEYPKDHTFQRRDDAHYRARCVYIMSYDPPIDGSTESYPPKSIQGVTPLIPGVPVCVDLNGNPDESVTIAALFDLKSLQRFPKYEKIKACAGQLWDVTWSNAGKTSVSTVWGFTHNMRSGAVNSDCPLDGSSSQATTRLEGNGKGLGIPALQTDVGGTHQLQLSFLQTLSKLYQHLALLALSKEEFLAITFRSVDLNVYSFGSLFPTGLTSVQLNRSSADKGGDLMQFMGAIQGAFHIDFHDDWCWWTLLVIFIKLPLGVLKGARKGIIEDTIATDIVSKQHS